MYRVKQSVISEKLSDNQKLYVNAGRVKISISHKCRFLTNGVLSTIVGKVSVFRLILVRMWEKADQKNSE